MEFSGVEIFGYCASALIAFSLTRSSIIKLRWYNLFGAASFCIYGVIIGAAPVAILNGFIALTNVVYLRKMLTQTDQHLSILEVSLPSNYVKFFLDFHKQEVDVLFPRFLNKMAQLNRRFFYLMENTEVVGLLSGFELDDGTFVVDFDFVIPAYRDCRLGQFVLGSGQHLKQVTQYDEIVAEADSPEHENYLKEIGFSANENGVWSYKPTT
ncbi:hypothetical protein [Aliiglaciecola litoralis]|uniref:N-acetyltransferase domain-containing protein n=1 Tax=Aliiglaciecola litoralis TaxID=582857 RepID=A0ABN1LHF1_9ALTE